MADDDVVEESVNQTPERDSALAESGLNADGSSDISPGSITTSGVVGPGAAPLVVEEDEDVDDDSVVEDDDDEDDEGLDDDD
jgi:hypothetical protein